MSLLTKMAQKNPKHCQENLLNVYDAFGGATREFIIEGVTQFLA